MAQMPKQAGDRFLVAAVLILVLCLYTAPAAAEPPPPADKTLSPYFFVKDADEALDPLPLQSTRAEVNISGVIAEVHLVQKYRNRGQRTLEAVYVFPASTRAAIHRMKMTIGRRVIVARIQERRAARRAYQEARSQGKTASLLEQQRPNVFQMSVANILPGDEITVELAYTEIVIPREGTYRFVLPTVVGPRYTEKGQGPGGEPWTRNPYLPGGRPSPFTLALDLTLDSPLPIARLSCPSHRADISYQGPRRARVRLAPSPQAGSKDFVLDYSLAGDRIQSGLLLFRGKGENFFLLMVEPPARVTPRQVLPREYLFLLDVSGSMRGFPLETSKRLMADLLGGLRPGDWFNVLFFAGDSLVLGPESLPANRENLARALDFVDRRRGGGGTRLLPALKRALALPARKGVSRSMVLISDGYVNVEKEAFELVRRHLGRANLFVFGIGSSVNRFLLEGLARVGQGQAQVVLNRREAAAKAREFRRYLSQPILGKIGIRAEGFAARDLEPARFPDLFARRPLVVVGKYRGPARGRLVITGQGPDGAFRRVIRVEQVRPRAQNAALARLWARRRIARLADLEQLSPEDRRRRQVVELGLKYGLLTDYTAFVAIDSRPRAQGGEPVRVRQPLPLPSGVPDSALARRLMPLACAAPSPPGILGGLPPRQKADKVKPVVPPRRLVLRVLHRTGACPGLSWPSLLEELRRRLQPCLRGLPGAKGKLLLRLALDRKGRLISLELGPGSGRLSPRERRELQGCLARLPGPGGGSPCLRATIEVVIP